MAPAELPIGSRLPRPGRPERHTAPDGYRYWAFISYSHRDQRRAGWLLRQLEGYRVPGALVGRKTNAGLVPARIRPVFRDRDELRGAPDLEPAIQAALRASYWLVVICSPEAAGSPYVDQEIRYFQSLGRADRILALVVSGEPGDPRERPTACFPAALLSEDAAEGGRLRQPLAADVRKGKDGKLRALLRIVAALVDVGFAELYRRDRRRWRRHAGLASLASALVLSAGYLAAADYGVGLPGSGHVRVTLDRQGFSVFRPVPSDADLQRAAAGLRTGYIADLRLRGTASGQLAAREGDTAWVDAWSTGQAAAALLGSPEATPADRNAAAALIDAAFRPGAALVRDAELWGWPVVENGRYSQAEPAVWTGIALARALAREPGSARYRTLTDSTQAVLARHHPLGDGGWNVFASQVEPAVHNTYATALALLYLLEARRAAVPWRGDAAARDTLINRTARWLVAHYDTVPEPGWRESGDARYDVYAPLTVLVYFTLLWTADEMDLSLPPRMLRDIAAHASERAELGLGAVEDDETGEFQTRILDLTGQPQDANTVTTFLWYPSGIVCSLRWVEWARAHDVPGEEVARVRRALGRLLVKDGGDALRQAREYDWAYPSAETLYTLSMVPPP